MKSWSTVHGESPSAMASIEDCSIDAIVTDPPYGIRMMGSSWDYDVPTVETWRECLRVLKPGGYLLAFAGTRTQHRMACAIEDAGFHIRDVIAWLYGSGFPKSMDVSKAIDKAAGVEREDKYDGATTRRAGPSGNRRCDTCGKWLVSGSPCVCPRPQDAPVSDAAKTWFGWGSAVKPAFEPITVARKPLEGRCSLVENVLKHGTGALNIDVCRIPYESEYDEKESKKKNRHADFDSGPMTNKVYGEFKKDRDNYNPPGRFPANVVHDGGPEVMALFPDDGGLSAARFFYSPKAAKGDRGEDNTHITVKPTPLMNWLCRLVTPPGGLVLDPFMGSGSTGVAALRAGFRFVGIDRDGEYVKIADKRLAEAVGGPLFGGGG